MLTDHCNFIKEINQPNLQIKLKEKILENKIYIILTAHTISKINVEKVSKRPSKEVGLLDVCGGVTVTTESRLIVIGLRSPYLL